MSNASSYFAWNPVSELQTCTMQALTWSYRGPTPIGNLNISVTDIDVAQQAPDAAMQQRLSASATISTTPVTSSTLVASTASVSFAASSSADSCTLPLQTDGARKRARFLPVICGRASVDSANDYGGYGGLWLPRINQTLVLNASAQDLMWAWPSVDLTEGWYVLVANIVNYFDGNVITNTSSPFFVRNGTTSCLAAASPTSSVVLSSPTASHVEHGTPTRSRDNIGAIAGGVVVGAVLLMGVFVAVVRRRKRHSSGSSTTTGSSTLVMTIPEPYDATNEQFPTQRCATFLPLAGRLSPSVIKELRQPLRYGPRIAQGNIQPTETSFTPRDAEGPLDQSEGTREEGPETEMVSMSLRALQALLRRVGGVGSSLQYSAGSDDGISGTAPPEYQEVVCS